MVRGLLVMAARAHLNLVRQLSGALLRVPCAGRMRPAAREGDEMSECLHCEINQLVQERFERSDTVLVESLADLILLAPESDRSNLMAHALSAFGQIVLEKGGAIDGGSSATH